LTFIRVNLSTGTVKAQEAPTRYRLLGGRALTSTLVFEEVDPTCDPLGPDNKLVVAPGLLSGGPASSNHRVSFGARSPLTGGIKESNAGGTVGYQLSLLGVKAVVVEGAAPEGRRVAVRVFEGPGGRPAAEIADAGAWWGKSTYEAGALIHEAHGAHCAFAVIGTPGEMRLPAAGAMHTDKDGVPARITARGGLGAVMGSKGLKALIVDPGSRRRVDFADRERYHAGRKRYVSNLRTTPATAETYPRFGTAAMVDVVNNLGGLPTCNFASGSFDRAEAINATALRETILKRGGDPSHPCMPGCVIRSSNVYVDRCGNEIVRSLEYETIGLCGSNLGIGDLDDIARINRLCNEGGLDTIEIGATLGVAMEAGLAEFGDAEAARRLIREILQGTVLGRLLGHGAALTGRVLGVKRVPAVKGQAISAYDPRAVKGLGVTYATSAMGADHTAGQTMREAVEHHKPEGQREASVKMQQYCMVFDSLGLCVFAHNAVKDNLEILADLVNGRLGTSVTVEDLFRQAREVLAREVEFNRRAGLTEVYDRLPRVFREEPLPPHGLVFDVPDDELDQVTKGWAALVKRDRAGAGARGAGK